jgi:hypothetical protein
MTVIVNAVARRSGASITITGQRGNGGADLTVTGVDRIIWTTQGPKAYLKDGTVWSIMHRGNVDPLLEADEPASA